METVTIPKKQYEMMKQQATLYEKIFKRAPVSDDDIEIYTPERIREFEKEDELDDETRRKIERVLASMQQ